MSYASTEDGNVQKAQKESGKIVDFERLETVKSLKYILTGLAVVLVAASAQRAQAANGTGPSAIAGSISFIGHANTDGSSIASATEFTTITAKVADDSGAYALVPSLQGPTPGITSLTSKGIVNVMTAYAFNPSQNTVTPLWKFTSGGITYSFDATSLAAVFDPSAGAWDISGLGDAIITGGGTSYSVTPGNWSAVVSGSGSAFNFGSAEDPPLTAAPDGGMTVSLLGAALLGLNGLRRKLA